eukprot:5417251-Karenia_brevis.AAC.1
MSKQGLRSVLGPSKSELSQRPAFGWSFFIAGTIRLSQSLDSEEGNESRLALQNLFESNEGRDFLRSLSETQWERAKDNPADKRNDFEA